MSLSVIDASVLVTFYSAEDPLHTTVGEHLSKGDAMFAPAHLDAEIASALRRLARANKMLARTVPGALAHLAGFPVRRMPLAPLLERMWDLRENVTPYDAAYIALAERINATLLTCDAKLAAASGPTCAFELIGPKRPRG